MKKKVMVVDDSRVTEARIVMVSPLAYDDTIEEADCIGAKGFLYKPLEKQTFLEALEQAMV